jgi:S1-C subfamily serine protease
MDMLRMLGHAERQQDDCNYRSLYDEASDGVVAVSVSNETGPIGEGSGWVYEMNNSTAYVVTNWHVIRNATEVDVQFNRGRWREAEVVGADLTTDLAVLRVENAPNSTTALRLARERAERGQSVAALGNPFGLEESVSRGIVSGVERAVTVDYGGNVTSTIPDTIQLDAAVNPGNSGGPLVNCRGRVLGVNYAGVGPVDAGVNFAISTTVVREVVPALIENGSYRHSFLGIRPVDVDAALSEANDLDVTRGVMVVDVLPGGPADPELQGAPAIHRRTELPFGGDVILAMDETRIADTEDLLTYLLFETDPGDTVNVTVLRDGENLTVPVTLGERPPVTAPPPETPTTTPETTTTITETETTTTTTTETETTTTTTTTTVVETVTA